MTMGLERPLIPTTQAWAIRIGGHRSSWASIPHCSTCIADMRAFLGGSGCRSLPVTRFRGPPPVTRQSAAVLFGGRFASGRCS